MGCVAVVAVMLVKMRVKRSLATPKCQLLPKTRCLSWVLADLCLV